MFKSKVLLNWPFYQPGPYLQLGEVFFLILEIFVLSEGENMDDGSCRHSSPIFILPQQLVREDNAEISCKLYRAMRKDFKINKHHFLINSQYREAEV